MNCLRKGVIECIFLLGLGLVMSGSADEVDDADTAAVDDIVAVVVEIEVEVEEDDDEEEEEEEEALGRAPIFLEPSGKGLVLELELELELVKCFSFSCSLASWWPGSLPALALSEGAFTLDAITLLFLS